MKVKDTRHRLELLKARASLCTHLQSRCQRQPIGVRHQDLRLVVSHGGVHAPSTSTHDREVHGCALPATSHRIGAQLFRSVSSERS